MGIKADATDMRVAAASYRSRRRHARVRKEPQFKSATLFVAAQAFAVARGMKRNPEFRAVDNISAFV